MARDALRNLGCENYTNPFPQAESKLALSYAARCSGQLLAVHANEMPLWNAANKPHRSRTNRYHRWLYDESLPPGVLVRGRARHHAH